MKTKRTGKTLSLLLTMCIMLTLLPTAAFAAGEALSVQGGNGAVGTILGVGSDGTDDKPAANSETAFDRISVVGGNGGGGGGGYRGGKGGDAELTLTASDVAVSGAVSVISGNGGNSGAFGGNAGDEGGGAGLTVNGSLSASSVTVSTGVDGTNGSWCGVPQLTVTGTLCTPSITVNSQNKADIYVTVRTLDVSEDTVITTNTDGAGGIVFNTVNIADGKKLTIENGQGWLYIGQINFTGSGTGRVVIQDSSKLRMSELNFFHSPAFDIPTGTVGTAIASIDVTGGVVTGGFDTTPYTYSATGLPAGITINPAGVISGTPSAACAAGTATITVTDSGSPPTSRSITIQYGTVNTLAFFDAATATFDLGFLPAANSNGGSGATAWSWSNSDKQLILSGAGPYTLTGTASGNMQVYANQTVDLTLNGAEFTCATNTALYLAQGGTVRVTADSKVTGDIDAGLGSLEIILSDADLQVEGLGVFGAITAWGLTLSGSGTVTATSEGGAVNCIGDLTVGTGCTLSAAGAYGIQFQGADTIRGGGSILATGHTYQGISENSVGKALTFDFTGNLSITGKTYAINMFLDRSDDTATVQFTRVPASLTMSSELGIIGTTGFGDSRIGTVTLQNKANIPGLTEAFNAGDKTFSATVSPTYLLTVQAGTGGTITTGAGGGNFRQGDSLPIGASANSNYTFSGWTSSNGGSFANAASAATTFTMPAGATTITANFIYTGGGTTAPAPIAPTVSGGTATTTVTPTVSNGTASASVTSAQVTSAIKAAKAAAQKSGDAPGVEIAISGASGAGATSVMLPQSSVQSLVTGGIDRLTVSGPVATMSFDSGALASVSAAASGDVTVAAERVNTRTLPEAVRAIVGDRPVYELSVTSGGKAISGFGGTVTVSIPYTPAAGEVTANLVIYYISDSGSIERVPNARYDAATGAIVFTTAHFSYYAVGYEKPLFSDVLPGAWYYDAVNFITENGITTGTGDGKFSPNATLTRGQFITMLLRAYDTQADANPADNFSDAGNTYYTGYLAAAKRLGITSGVGGNKFAPEQAITRQEMFTLLYNALKLIGALPTLDSGKTLADFTDSAQVASWANEAMTTLVKSGIISGNGGKLDPKATTTRAQMAQVLYNLLGK